MTMSRSEVAGEYIPYSPVTHSAERQCFIFTIRPLRASALFLVVHLFDTVDALRKDWTARFSRSSTDFCDAQAIVSARDSMPSNQVAEMGFNRGAFGMRTISHEAVHGALRFLDVATEKDLSELIDFDDQMIEEERLAHLVGEIARAVILGVRQFSNEF